MPNPELAGIKLKKYGYYPEFYAESDSRGRDVGQDCEIAKKIIIWKKIWNLNISLSFVYIAFTSLFIKIF